MSPPTAPSFFLSTSSHRSPARYPDTPAERTRWILARREPRNRLDPRRAYGALVEEERTESGEAVPVATIFLTNRECPWHCLMCDLWTNTLAESVAPGAIPEQIRVALEGLPPARRLKLYNAGSFFDPKAIPTEDLPTIAALAAPFDRVVVESHPALVGEACFRFGDLAGGRLEVALGLETAHPEALARLNKGMTLLDFRRAAAALCERAIRVRAFVLVGLPFVPPGDQRAWCLRSVAFAFECGAGAVSLIPTRAGNGALDALRGSGDFQSPTLGALEEAMADGIALGRGCVFADLWDIEKLAACGSCRAERATRLRQMSLAQTLLPPVPCAGCGGTPRG